MPRTFPVLPICLLLHLNVLNAQETLFMHLHSAQNREITLICEWDSILMANDNSSWDGLMVETCENGTEEWKAGLTIRGKFRRAKCAFPPLEINVKKGALRDHGMMEFDKLKLVTHCDVENQDPADIFEELLVYQLYALLTEYSYRVLPLHVDYKYPNGKTFQKNADALILEPTAELAYRLEGQELEGYGVPADSLDAMSYCRTALFQFMIGNFDWDHTLQRNIKMIGPPGQYRLVPYDFDFSALVIPMYARMPSDFGIKDFRDRVYLGSLFGDHLPQTIREFIEKKDVLLSHVSNYEHLSKSRCREITSYLEKFFEFISQADVEIVKGTILPYQEK